jgi:hypothetical protein
VIKDKVLEKECKRDFELSRHDRFRYRTRYFTDSGIIVSKKFVSENYQRFKNIFSMEMGFEAGSLEGSNYDV